MNNEEIENVLTEMARLSGHALNAQERLIVRTKVASVQAAKARYRQRMNAQPYEWRRPDKPRR